MNRKYGIGILVVFFALIVLFILAYRFTYQKALEKAKTEERIQTDAKVEICYYIKATDGYVTVYEADNRTVYEYTSIVVEDLPRSIQKELEQGIKVTSVGQVYGFLENYSS